MMKALPDIQTAWKDDGLIAAIKPQGPATGLGKEENLCARLFALYPSLGKVRGYREGEGGLLHRLDNETGGLVLFARTDESFQYYSAQMKQGLVRKKYCAICCDFKGDEIEGGSGKTHGIITIPLAHHEIKKNRMTRADAKGFRGKPQTALTEWNILGRKNGFCLVQAIITKGVRHQIRLHLSLLGLPIAGDRLYKSRESAFLIDDARFDMHALFCNELSLTLQSGYEKTINAECPVCALWERL